jgi:predicted site-specific integrase-resolvase
MPQKKTEVVLSWTEKHEISLVVEHSEDQDVNELAEEYKEKLRENAVEIFGAESFQYFEEEKIVDIIHADDEIEADVLVNDFDVKRIY